MSLIAWLEASTFIKVYGLHSLTDVVKLGSAFQCRKMINVINTLLMMDCSNIRKRGANIKRDIENKLIFLNVWHHLRFIKFNNFGTRHLNGPRHLFLSFSCTIRHIFGPLCVFEPGFNTDKYGMYVCMHMRMCLSVCVCMFVLVCMYVCVVCMCV